jgi:hypothetical protein
MLGFACAVGCIGVLIDCVDIGRMGQLIGSASRSRQSDHVLNLVERVTFRKGRPEQDSATLYRYSLFYPSRHSKPA